MMANEKTWNLELWGGMTEQQAFEDNPSLVLEAMGEKVASQTWNCGSWSSVYKYREKYYSLDEVEVCEFQQPSEAFKRANIGNESFSKIDSLSISQGYESFVSLKSIR